MNPSALDLQAALDELNATSAEVLRSWLPSSRAREIVSAFRDQMRAATFPEEIENVYSALEECIRSAIVQHAKQEVGLRRAAVADSQRAKDFLHNVACGPWYRLEDREPLLGDSALLMMVERNMRQYYRLGNHEPEERVVCWARIYPPRTK